MIGVSAHTPFAAALAILFAATFQPRAMAAQCQALVGVDGLRTVASDGSLIQKLSPDLPSFAVWSPDGRHIAGAFRSGEFRIFAADGSPHFGMVMPAIAPIRYLRWILPGTIAMKSSPDAPDLISFIRLSPNMDAGEMLPSGFFGGFCMPSADSGPTACLGARDIRIMQPGRKATFFHPINALDPVFKQSPIEVRIGETARSATEPSFQVAVTRVQNVNGSAGPPGKFEIQVIAAGGQKYLGERGSGESYELDLDGVHWSFVLNTLDSGRRRFRIDIYKDDSNAELTGLGWARDSARVFVWETTRRGDALVTLSMTGKEWALSHLPMRMDPGTPHGIMSVHNGLNLDPDGKSAIVESAKTVYRCVIDAAVCEPIASRPPDVIDTRVGGTTMPAKVLDWYCPAGN
jgi:hypothetical protein